jgi:hypothetical protein
MPMTMQEMRALGWSYREIGKSVGRSHEWVRTHLGYPQSPAEYEAGLRSRWEGMLPGMRGEVRREVEAIRDGG